MKRSRRSISSRKHSSKGLFLAQRAVELAPHLSDARLELAAMLLWLHRSAESRTEFECSLELNPNLADYQIRARAHPLGPQRRGDRTFETDDPVRSLPCAHLSDVLGKRLLPDRPIH
jgi:hypothetical protein